MTTLKSFFLSLLDFFGMGPPAIQDTPRQRRSKLSDQDYERIEVAKQKRLRKQAKRMPPEMG